MPEPLSLEDLLDLFKPVAKRFKTDPAILMACMLVSHGKIGFLLLAELRGDTVTHLPITKLEPLTDFLRVLRTPTPEECAEIMAIASDIAIDAPKRPKPHGLKWNLDPSPGG